MSPAAITCQPSHALQTLASGQRQRQLPSVVIVARRLLLATANGSQNSPTGAATYRPSKLTPTGHRNRRATCNASGISFNGEKGVPLADLDTSGSVPTAIALLGPDNVRVTRGDKLAITVDGDDAGKLRFAMSDGQLGIAREGWKLGQSTKSATVNVTLPMLSDV
ncbi:DUF2807 domain-containing protein, partial [Reyranella sp.]|uniref:GIN domain-containing protein n=1 Tax=Reyranella sp. TaxID=1929291 RepID=UPI002629C52F